MRCPQSNHEGVGLARTAHIASDDIAADTAIKQQLSYRRLHTAKEGITYDACSGGAKDIQRTAQNAAKGEHRAFRAPLEDLRDIHLQAGLRELEFVGLSKSPLVCMCGKPRCDVLILEMLQNGSDINIPVQGDDCIIQTIMAPVRVHKLLKT